MRSEPGTIPQITVDELAPAVEERRVIIDVRMPDEYEEGHVAGALLIPLPELAEREAEIPAGDPVHVVCRSGGRSQTACEYLVTRGRSVVNVAGGTLAWIESGRPVVTGPEPG